MPAHGSTPAEAPATSARATWDPTPVALSEALLTRYLEHLAVARPTEPTLAALGELITAHLHAIPFENLDPILGRPVSLDHTALVDKLTSGDRGGYCFEHNVLFAGALVALGYRVRMLAGRALVGLAPGEVRPRTHLALLVTSSGASERLVDVGFGRTTLNGPLVPETDLVQQLGTDRYRLVEHDGERALEAARGTDGPWVELYLLDPRPVYAVDIEMANHFVATHPHSHMRRNLLLLRQTPGGRRAVTFGELLIDEDGRHERRTLELADLAGVLRDEFGIVSPAPLDHVPRG